MTETQGSPPEKLPPLDRDDPSETLPPEVPEPEPMPGAEPVNPPEERPDEPGETTPDDDTIEPDEGTGALWDQRGSLGTSPRAFLASLVGLEGRPRSHPYRTLIWVGVID